jgi:hypothetical protein
MMNTDHSPAPRPRFVWTNLLLVVVLTAAIVALFLYQPWHERPPKPTAVGTSPQQQSR